MERGYIKIYRKILDSGIIQNAHAFQLFGYLLLSAAYKPVSRDVRGEMISIEPGQIIFGRQKAANFLKMSEKNIRTALKYLEKNEIVAIRATKRYSIISIINWDTYQTKNDNVGQQNGHETAMSGPCEGHEAAMKRPSSGHETATVKEFKNNNNLSIKESKNLNTSCSEAKNRSEQEIELMPEEIFIELPVIGKDAGEHKVTKREIEQWRELYPAVDIEQELRKMKGYFLGSPQKRKTRSGINKSIHHWLSSAQNQSRQNAPKQPPKTFAEIEEEREKQKKADWMRKMAEKYGGEV